MTTKKNVEKAFRYQMEGKGVQLCGNSVSVSD